MATADAGIKSQDKHTRSKLLSWMKRLTKNKSTSKKQHTNGFISKNPNEVSNHARKNELPASGDDIQADNGFNSLHTNDDGSSANNDGNRSLAPTLATNPGTINSEMAPSDADRTSKSGTSHTMTGGMSSTSAGGGNSIFTSSNHSSHSLATTLTTIQSAPSNNGQTPHAHGNQGNPAFFGYPGAPPSAIPPHLTPHVPTTYRSATANNLLSDNASVLTLASSSHRPQRRNSLDTNASIRAIAPSSVWGGSRESLSLSVLSQTADAPTVSTNTTPSTAGIMPSGSRSVSGLVNSERGPGAPLLSSERNSLYTTKTSAKDGDSIKGGSIRSGMIGHGRNDSTAGSIGGYSSPLVISKSEAQN